MNQTIKQALLLAAASLLPAVAPAQTLQLATPSLEFGQVALGEEAELSLELANIGVAESLVRVDSIAVEGAGYALVGDDPAGSLILAGGQTAMVAIRFAPQAAGVAEGDVVVEWSGSATGAGGSPVVATFQQGANGYSGARSANISTLNVGAWNGFNGTTFTDEPDWCIGDLPAQNYDISPLLAFGDLGIPAGSVVQSATLRCFFVSWDSGQHVVARYLRVPWTEQHDSNGDGVGWQRRDTGQPWGAPGARAEGVDVESGLSTSWGPMTATGNQTHTATLNTAMAQGWIDDPATNYGIVMTVDLLDHHTGYRQPQNSNAADRPVLTITYLPAPSFGASQQTGASLSGVGGAPAAVDSSAWLFR